MRTRWTTAAITLALVGGLLAGLPGASSAHDPDTPAGRSSAVAFMAQREPTQQLTALAQVSCSNGQAGGYPCRNVDLLSFLPLSQIGGSQANDIWGWTDPGTGREYAIVGRRNGTSFVDISDPTAPIYLGNLPAYQNRTAIWRDIKVYRNHAFVVADVRGHGMQVFDLTRLRSVGSPQTFTADAHYNRFGNSHNIAINEQTGYAYAVGSNTCRGGLHMIDIRTPTSPAYAQCC
ncbi:choice-of-anchor B domain-containing protein [Micromonospora sp. Llam0]|uniref:choice-of-anchor B family protein n=1 Tax=Micromonospora sp. Llam0 TaxID=2485143 RepID=UPI000F461B9A|nr:choice-of-anchor B family protein [Micromonospora sp. Llam0]ROO60840.1 choice-of-anchor B domain-containing protein [Micromonospora sp. Llam0]